MSIILDALKKAEKERTPTEDAKAVDSFSSPPSSPAPSFTPIAPEPLKEKKRFPMKLIIIPLVLAIIGGGGFEAYRLIKNKLKAKVKAKTKAMLVVPDDPAIILGEAQRFFVEGNFPESRLKWEKLTELEPENAELYNNLGVVFKKMGEKNRAREAYDMALKIKPDYPEGLTNLGILFLEEQVPEQAQELFEKAISINPHYAEAHYLIAKIHENNLDRAKAILHYEKFLELKPKLDAKTKGKIEMRISVLKLGNENESGPKPLQTASSPQ